MFGILIVSHGSLASSLLGSLRHVLGQVPQIGAINFQGENCLQAKCTEIRDAISALDEGAGVVVITDMHGGSPCNLAVRAVMQESANAVILTGANLPMLVSLAKARERPLTEAADAALEAGRRYVLCVGSGEDAGEFD